ncbi:MAG: Microbacterium phage OneinaGillian [Actinomycetota bacterium]|jgi:hypothetical protein
MTERQTIKVAIDAGELAAEGMSQEWSTMRRDIDRHGALHVGDGFGVIGLRINGNLALTLHLHEDQKGQVVLDIIDPGRPNSYNQIQLEDRGMVPPRTKKPRVR